MSGYRIAGIIHLNGDTFFSGVTFSHFFQLALDLHLGVEDRQSVAVAGAVLGGTASAGRHGEDQGQRQYEHEQFFRHSILPLFLSLDKKNEWQTFRVDQQPILYQ